MHVVMHDLHEYHHDEHAAAFLGQPGHGDHEHPIVSSPVPQVPNPARVALPVVEVPAAVTAATSTSVATTNRNIASFGALRLDDDVGLQPLLSTFLI